MKKLLIIVLLIALISASWVIYQSEQDKQQLKVVLTSKNEDIALLEQEVDALKKRLSDVQTSEAPEPTINSLVDDANTVLKESLDSALKGVQDELDRVKSTLSQELENLRLDNMKNGTDSQKDSNPAIDPKNKKHST